MLRYMVLIFAIFPFTQILPLGTYNQPYAFVSGLLTLLFFPRIYGALPQLDRLMLAYLALLGLAMFVLISIDGPSLREMQYLLVYVSPAVIVPALVAVMSSHTQSARRILTGGILIWISVALVQRFISPGFLVSLTTGDADLALNILASGRGQLGLAPEPTHHGLHLLAMGAALMMLRGSVWVVGLAFASALLLALSSFAALMLMLAVVMWAMLRPWRWPVLVLAFSGTTLFLSYGTLLFSEGTRLGSLLRVLQTEGVNVLMSDASTNARIFGIISPIAESARGFFAPLGMEYDAWIEMSRVIVQNNPSIFFLSGAGPASGYGLILVQAGFFSFPFLYYVFKRLCLAEAGTWRGLGVIVGFTTFIGQIYLSTPSFSLVMATAITAVLLRRDKISQSDERENASSQSVVGT